MNSDGDDGEIPPATLDLVRQLGDLAARGAVGADAWARLHRVLETMVPRGDDLEGTESRYAAKVRKAMSGDPSRIWEVTHPISGGTTLAFPRFSTAWNGTTLQLSVRFDHSFEGPPGVVHGGFLAAGFDVAASAAAWHLAPLMITRSLSVRYFRPTPVGEPVTFEATPTWIDRRRAHVECRAIDGRGLTTARAEGECATLPPKRFGSARPGERRPDARPSVTEAERGPASS